MSGTGPIPTGPSASTPSSPPTPGPSSSSALKHRSRLPLQRGPQGRGHSETPPAYLADALVALVTGEPACVSEESTATGSSGHRLVPGHRIFPEQRSRATVVFRVDATALQAGLCQSGRDVRPSPGWDRSPWPPCSRQLSDAFVKILVLDGKDVTPCATRGATSPPMSRAPSKRRDPVCVVPECDVASGCRTITGPWTTPSSRRPA